MTEGRLRLAIGVLALVGAGVSAYLTYRHYAGGQVFCLAGGSGCEKVQHSKYATLAGVPVAVLGLGAYAAIFSTSLFRGRVAALIGAAVALAGALFSAWLLYAQIALIDAICQWCVANDVVIALLAVLTTLRLRQST